MEKSPRWPSVVSEDPIKRRERGMSKLRRARSISGRVETRNAWAKVVSRRGWSVWPWQRGEGRFLALIKRMQNHLLRRRPSNVHRRISKLWKNRRMTNVRFKIEPGGSIFSNFRSKQNLIDVSWNVNVIPSDCCWSCIFNYLIFARNIYDSFDLLRWNDVPRRESFRPKVQQPSRQF